MRKFNKIICWSVAIVGGCLLAGCALDAVTDGVTEGISAGVAALIEELILAVGEGINDGM